MTDTQTDIVIDTDERAGRRFRVIFDDGTKHLKQVVLVFLGEAFDGTEYVFDGRPLAGTQRLRKTSVRTMIETEYPLAPMPRKVGTS